MDTPHTKTTIRRAKAEFKRSGPRLPEGELRKLERAAELERRADGLREKENRRKQAKRKREEREDKEREAKRRMGVGLATQLAGFSHTQKRMKSGMEAFLAKGKDKENVDSKAVDASKLDGDISAALGERVGSQMQGESHTRELWEAEEDGFDDEELLAHLEPVQEDTKTPALYTPRRCTNQKPAPDMTDTVMPAPRKNSPKSEHFTSAPEPIADRSPFTGSSPLVWEDFMAGNTQLTQELRQHEASAKVSPIQAPMIPISTQDLVISSNDLLDLEVPSTVAHTITCPRDGVIARDFAYFKRDQNGELILGTPGVPKNEAHSLSKRAKTAKPRSFLTSSPKITASGFQPGIAERSFTSRFDDFGLSTQLLQDAVDDTDSDTEEEDFAAIIPSVPVDRDRELMPPPPPRTSPVIFKPPSPSQSKRNNFQAFGLSTQILNDVVDFSDDEAAEGASSSFGIEDLDGAFWDEAASNSV